MRTKNELYQEALRTVARRRQTARAKAEDARAEAEAAVPGLRHAEEEVRVRGIRCALAGAAGKDRTDAAAALTDARKKLADLLASSGRPADALEPHFTCRLCEDTGIVDPHKNILALQGPFSYALNRALLEQFSIRFLVTKDGGAAGGFAEKAQAAADTGVQLIVIRRPAETGETADQILTRCREVLKG